MTRYLLFFALALLPLGVYAQIDYIPLVGIPGVDLSAPDTLGQYINALYILVISIAAFLAVLRLIMAGVKYIVSDVVTTKESAKKDIYTSLLGILIVLSAVLILNTINPQLTNLTALDNLDAFEEQISNVRIVDTGNSNDESPSGECPEGSTLEVTTGGATCAPTDRNNDGVPDTIVIQGVGSDVDLVIDTTIVYTVNDPAIPAAGLPAGLYHNSQVTILSANMSQSAPPEPRFIVMTTDGNTLNLGCKLLEPSIPGCR